MAKRVLTRSSVRVLGIVAAIEALVGLHLELGQVSLNKHPLRCFLLFFHIYLFIFNFLFLNFEIYLELFRAI